MKPFFAYSSRISTLREAAARWEGTPFAAEASVQGAGVDCVRLAAALYLECGALVTAPVWPRYRLDEGKHSEGSKLVTWLSSCATFVGGPNWHRDEPQVGDLIVFRRGRSPHHCGVLLRPRQLIHAVERIGVTHADPQDPTIAGDRTHSIWTPIELT